MIQWFIALDLERLNSSAAKNEGLFGLFNIRWQSRLHSDIQGAQQEQNFSALNESDQDVQLWTARVGTDSA